MHKLNCFLTPLSCRVSVLPPPSPVLWLSRYGTGIAGTEAQAPKTGVNYLTIGGEMLGVSVPQNLKLKGYNWERGVRFSLAALVTLLEAAPSERNSGGLTLVQVRWGQQVVFKPPTTRNKMFSIELWTKAFLVCASIFMQASPGRGQELLKFCQSIRSASARFSG